MVRYVTLCPHDFLSPPCLLFSDVMDADDVGVNRDAAVAVAVAVAVSGAVAVAAWTLTVSPWL